MVVSPGHKPELVGGGTLDSLKSDLRRLLTEVALLPPGFDEKADFYSDLGMPSMKAMEVLMALEERFGVSVPDEEFVEATSLERLVALMQTLDLHLNAAV